MMPRVLEWLGRKFSRKSDVVRVQGPLECIDGRWLMRIPLNIGGDRLAHSARGTGEIKGEFLEISLPENLVRNLKLKEGQHLIAHNAGGRFTFEWESVDRESAAGN